MPAPNNKCIMSSEKHVLLGELLHQKTANLRYNGYDLSEVHSIK